MIRRETTRAEFESATRAMAEQLSKTGTKIEVLFKGNGAYTDGSTIVLPAGDPLRMMTEEEQGVLAGFVDHEAAHLLFTDMNAYAEQDKIAKSDPFFHELVNASEDMRIEPQMMRNWPGTRGNFDDVSRNVNERTLDAMRKHAKEIDFSDEREWLPVAVTWEGRKRMGLNHELHSKMLDMLGDNVKAKANTICDEIATLKDGRDGTRQVIDMVKRYIDVIEREEMAKVEAKPGGDDGDKVDADGKGDGDKSDGAASSDATPDEAESERGDDESGSEGESEDKDDKSKADAAEQEVGESTGTKRSKTPRRVSLAPEVVSGADATGYRNVVSEPVFHHRTSGPIMMYELRRYDGTRMRDVSQVDKLNKPRGDEVYQHDMDQLRGNVATMRTKLRRALMAKRDRLWEAGHRSGRFDSRRIAQALRGADDIYMRRQDGQDIDTAVQICVDCSGSMDGEKIDLARKTAVALASALEGTGVAYEIVGFTNLRTAKTDAEKEMIISHFREHRSKASTYGAIDRVHIYEFKRFDEPIREARRAIGNMSDMWLMENNDADSLLAMFPRLKKRHEARKIMMVLSDGSPYCETYGGTHTILHKRMKPAIETIAKSGIDLIGIGIMDESVKAFYPKYEVVKSLSSLSGRVIDNIAKMLLGERFNADNAKVSDAA